MAFWNRRKKNDLANEFREYYQPAGGERSGLAWVLALITLVCSVFLIVSLFWGGRWVYRKVTNKDTNNTANTTPVNRPTIVPGASVTPAPGNGAAPTPTSAPSAAATPTPTTTGGVQGANTVAPTPAPSGLPSTGPDIDL